MDFVLGNTVLATIFFWTEVYRAHEPTNLEIPSRKESNSARWLAKLLGCQFEVQYHPGPDNKVVDALF